MINEVVQNKQARSGRSYLRCVGGVQPDLASKWEAEVLSLYFSCIDRVMSSVRQGALCEDGAGLGDRPEETMST